MVQILGNREQSTAARSVLRFSETLPAHAVMSSEELLYKTTFVCVPLDLFICSSPLVASSVKIAARFTRSEVSHPGVMCRNPCSRQASQNL